MDNKFRNKYFSIVFKKELDRWKKENKKTQENFAEEVGLESKNSITDYRTGKSFPKPKTLQAISEVLGVDANVFTTPSMDYFLDVLNSFEAKPITLETTVKVMVMGNKSEITYPDGKTIEVDTEKIKLILEETSSYMSYLFDKLQK